MSVEWRKIIVFPDGFRTKSGITIINDFRHSNSPRIFFSSGFGDICSFAFPGKNENTSGIPSPSMNRPIWIIGFDLSARKDTPLGKKSKQTAFMRLSEFHTLRVSVISWSNYQIDTRLFLKTNDFILLFYSKRFWSSIIICIDVHFPLLQSLSDTLHAATPKRIFISAFNTILLLALEMGRLTEIIPCVLIFVYINRFYLPL